MCRNIIAPSLWAVAGALGGAIAVLWLLPGNLKAEMNARHPITGSQGTMAEGEIALRSGGQGRIRAVDESAGIYALEWRRLGEGEDWKGTTYQFPDWFTATVTASVMVGEHRRFKYRYEIQNSKESGQYLSGFFLQTFSDSIRPIARPWDLPGRMSSTVEGFTDGAWMTFRWSLASEWIDPGTTGFVEFESNKPPQLVNLKMKGGDQSIVIRGAGGGMPRELDDRIPRKSLDLWPRGVTIGPSDSPNLQTRAGRIAYLAEALDRLVELNWLDAKLIEEYRVALARDGEETDGLIEDKVRRDFEAGRITPEFVALLSFLPPRPPKRAPETFSDALSSGGRGPEMAWIPPGRFQMGCAWSAACTMDGVPERGVEFAARFGMSRHEVTRAEFARFVEATGYRTEGERGQGCRVYADNWERDLYRNWKSPGFMQTDHHPVVCVSWEDASAYALWLAAETGRPYRLPSESEWEYAARAGSMEKLGYKDDQTSLCRTGNAADQTAQERYPGWRSVVDCSDHYVYTAPVGQFRANDFGLYDMYGNVQEWVLDCRNSNFERLPSDGSASIEGDCRVRTMRGSSWASGTEPYFPDIRFSHRDTFIPTFHSIYAGFRVAVGNP